MTKKLICITLVCVLAASLFAACGGGSAPPAANTPAPSSSSGGTTTTAPADDAGLPHVNLTMYLLGDEPPDLALVYSDLVNPLLNEKINATLTTNYLSWGDWRDMYSLILAAGEDVDLMFTADWALFAEESAKGAFMEFTPEFMAEYMPNTLRYQNPASLMQATINGKTTGIPKNISGLEGESWIMIRKDLREKYGMDEIKTAEQLEAYFVAVTQNEDGVFPHHASADGGFLSQMYTQIHELFFLPGTDSQISYAFPGDGVVPPASAIEYFWFREDLLPYFETMKRWADMGFWSANAISNDIQVRDSFENGRSASLTWNFTIFRALENLRKNNEEWDAEAIDINPGTARRGSFFTNDIIAIAAASRNKERAAMFIDLLKDEQDLEFYNALIGGIEGTHYILNADGTRSAGPDFEKYPWNPSTWCFNPAPGVAAEEGGELEWWSAKPEEDIWTDMQMQWIKFPEVMGFRLDLEPIRAEYMALTALRDEYRPMLQLGMAADIGATWAEWKQKAENIGLDKMMAEIHSQYDAWLAVR
ncbi:MAG: ABC transporter substrate-binding protein [Oscillospiraceae bacterium]|nr:ABC transporter substrate-binding protein [Oscillospiraceae bacterium]